MREEEVRWGGYIPHLRKVELIVQGMIMQVDGHQVFVNSQGEVIYGPQNN